LVRCDHDPDSIHGFELRVDFWRFQVYEMDYSENWERTDMAD
jgi:hypothetical protein